jgi:hypothetical protein
VVLELVLAVRQDLRASHAVPVGARDVPALPLRPDHASGLEDLHPVTLVWLVVVGLWIQSPWNIWN